MKKIIIAGIITFTVLYFVFHFGIQIGNVTIGHKIDTLKTKQSSSLENSLLFQKYLNTDKLIVLNFWATWCEPCVGEIPTLNTVKEKYKDQNIAFLSFSMDTDSLKLVKFNTTKKFQFIDVTFENLHYKTAIQNFLEHKPLDESITMQSVPVTYIIKNKKVLKKFDGTIESTELTTEIDKLLKN
jgi:thiol-disulfide isomerase/thioredoxin